VIKVNPLCILCKRWQTIRKVRGVGGICTKENKKEKKFAEGRKINNL
jgi:hypothetical protein